MKARVGVPYNTGGFYTVLNYLLSPMDALLRYWPIVAWLLSCVGMLMFLSRWFGRFEERMDTMVAASKDSVQSIEKLRDDLHGVGERVANVEGRVTSLENRK